MGVTAVEPTTELTAMSEQEKRPLLPTERADHPPSSDFPSRRVGKAGADGPAARVPPREGALPLARDVGVESGRAAALRS